jgi:copper(I)-binding protein
MKLRPLAFALACILPGLAHPAHADAVLTLDHGGTWTTTKDGEDTPGFIQIHNTGDAADTLSSVNCTIGASTTLVDASGNPLASLNIPAGQSVTLSANGPHLLIKAARYKIKKDGILPCAFTFAQSGELIGYLNATKPPK